VHLCGSSQCTKYFINIFFKLLREKEHALPYFCPNSNIDSPYCSTGISQEFNTVLKHAVYGKDSKNAKCLKEKIRIKELRGIFMERALKTPLMSERGILK
jgi:hypothetical protein